MYLYLRSETVGLVQEVLARTPPPLRRTVCIFLYKNGEKTQYEWCKPVIATPRRRALWRWRIYCYLYKIFTWPVGARTKNTRASEWVLCEWVSECACACVWTQYSTESYVYIYAYATLWVIKYSSEYIVYLCLSPTTTTTTVVAVVERPGVRVFARASVELVRYEMH